MRKIFVVAIAIILIAGFLILPSNSVSAANEPLYGYSLLVSDVQRRAYQEVVAGVNALSEEISLSVYATEDTLQSVANEVVTAIDMVLKDYPEFFWFSNEYSIFGSGTADNLQIIVEPEYSLNGQKIGAEDPQIEDARDQLNQVVTSVLSTIPSNASDYEVALVLHDYLVDHVTYAEEGDHQTAYGALVNGTAVCAGYARAYQLLLMQAGVPCAYIQGESYNPNGHLVNHAWNLVWLDGNCYYTDVTWDDQEESGVFHEYFNLSKEEISITHFLNANEILPESCGHYSYRFFIKNSGEGVCDIREQKEDTDIANCFRLKSLDGRKAEYTCTIHYHKNDFKIWLDAHYKNIGKILGFESVGYELVSLGHEYHLLLKGTLADAAQSPSETATESVPTQQSSPTQQTTQGTQQTDPPNQENTSTQPASSPSEIGQVQSPTEPTDPTNPSDPIEPVTPTDASQESQIGSEPAGNQQTTQSYDGTSSDPTRDTDKDVIRDKSGDTTVVTISIITGVIIAGSATGAFLYFRIRKRRS